MSRDKRRIIFIVNPISGTQGKQQTILDIKDRLRPESLDYEIRMTQYAGHAREIALEEALKGTDTVVAVGGDGTVNEVASALVGSQTALGIIPFGSGNGLARHLMIPMAKKRALEVVIRGLRESVDYGTINQKPFFCTCGCGFDAFVSQKFSEKGKRGPLSYVEEALKEMLQYEPQTYKISVDGTESIHEAFVIACGNAAQYGNNAFITPHAAISDGLLDVTILSPFQMKDIPELSLQLFTKTLDQNPRIETLRCKSLTIHREKEGVVHYDGDPAIMEKDLSVEIHPKALNVLIPSESERAIDMAGKAQEMVNGWRQLNERFFIKGVSMMTMDKLKDRISGLKNEKKSESD